MRAPLALTLLFAAALSTAAPARVIAHAPVNQAAIAAERPPELLSAYRFFQDERAREPNSGVTPYDLNTPLWSDGALKFRFVFVPPGSPAQYDPDRVFAFPVGTVLIKTFAFAADMRRPGEAVRLLETRLLIRRESGWVTLPYVWNDAQTDAVYSPAGATFPVSFTSEDGAAVALDWHVPNRNECRACHDRAGAITPIGPNARNLNTIWRSEPNDEGEPNEVMPVGMSISQLRRWQALGILDHAPADAPRVPNAYDSNDGTLDQRARAYLDVNCAHCHNPEGPGHTSGLDLSWSQSDPARWGVYKRPVAAGRGAADFAFDIEPGHPDRSILLHRMASTDPGVMMPEIGRQLVDGRAAALMRDWIAEMDEDGSPRGR